MFKLFFISIFSLIFLLIVSVLGYLKLSVPKMDGEFQITALKDKVEIFRDKAGIPHIYAKNDKDLYFSLGYLMASERLFQMEISRRVANGELSEIIGEKGLLSDKMFRNLKLRKSMEEMLASSTIDQKMKMQTDAFYAGVNEFQNTQILPIEFRLLNIKPRPFSILDGYAFVGYMSFSFALALNQDPLLSTLEKRLGTELVEEMRIEKINSPKKMLLSYEKSAFDKTKIPELISFLENGFPIFEGSNGWLISKDRMENGENLLANDPHITFSHPEIWFEAHLHTPDSENYGHFLPLIPFPILAHNRSRAWGLTMTLTDDMDLYREKLIGNDEYEFKKKIFPLKKSTETILVKGQKNYSFELSETAHGPILNQVLSEKNLAIKWVFHDPKNDPLRTLFSMSEAKNIAEFKTAVSTGVAPGLNVLYADRNNIGWWMFGKIDLKPLHVRSDFVLDGASGRDDYTGVLAFDDKPHSENPKNGIIVSANAKPVNFPLNQRGDWQPADRFNTIETLLSKKQKWTVDEIKEIQTLSMNFDNKIILEKMIEELKNVTKNMEYLNALKNWDLVSDVKSPGAAIFFTLFNKIGANSLIALSKDELETFSKMASSYNFTKRIILEEENHWWKKYNRNKIFVNSFHETVNSLAARFGKDSKKWEWGKIHTLEFMHPLGKISPLNHIFNLGPYPLAGATQDVNNQKSSSFKEVFEVKAGPSTRRIISFGSIDKTEGILPIGESSHLLSPFYNNQVEDFLNGKYRAMYLNNDLIKKNYSHYLIMIP